MPVGILMISAAHAASLELLSQLPRTGVPHTHALFAALQVVFGIMTGAAILFSFLTFKHQQKDRKHGCKCAHCQVHAFAHNPPLRNASLRCHIRHTPLHMLLWLLPVAVCCRLDCCNRDCGCHCLLFNGGSEGFCARMPASMNFFHPWAPLAAYGQAVLGAW